MSRENFKRRRAKIEVIRGVPLITIVNRENFKRRRAKPWPERPVSAANKSGKEEAGDVSALSGTEQLGRLSK